jgi:hypothetical protein
MSEKTVITTNAIDSGIVASARRNLVKAAKGTQREAQKNWQKAWEKRGGIYILARSVEDVYKGLDISVDDNAYSPQQ